jgi:Transglycosylase SLT domain
MFREIAQIVLAIQLSSSHVPTHRAEQLAKVIQQQSEKIDIDPIIEVAIITHESQFNERAISGDQEDYGLMQIRAKYHGPNARQWLLNGEANIRTGSDVIRASRDFCRKYLHREPTIQEWMAAYQGSVPTCRPTRLTQQVEDYANCLVAELDSLSLESELGFNCKKIYPGY